MKTAAWAWILVVLALCPVIASASDGSALGGLWYSVMLLAAIGVVYTVAAISSLVALVRWRRMRSAQDYGDRHSAPLRKPPSRLAAWFSLAGGVFLVFWTGRSVGGLIGDVPDMAVAAPVFLAAAWQLWVAR